MQKLNDIADLVGTYRLQSFQIHRKDGTTSPWAENAHGTLLYGADGSMSVAINGAPVEAGLKGEALLAKFLFYSGTYQVADGVVRHHVTEATDPQRIGKAMVREARWLAPGELELSATADYGRSVLVWKRSR